MSNSDKTPPESKGDWEGFREIDRAIAENREDVKVSLAEELGPIHGSAEPSICSRHWFMAAFLLYVAIYDGLI